jgi:hypothetical protein
MEIPIGVMDSDIEPVEGQLWRLLVVASVDPRLWAEERANEGELVEPRQLDGLLCQDALAPGVAWMVRTTDKKSRRVDQCRTA